MNRTLTSLFHTLHYYACRPVVWLFASKQGRPADHETPSVKLNQQHHQDLAKYGHVLLLDAKGNLCHLYACDADGRPSRAPIERMGIRWPGLLTKLPAGWSMYIERDCGNTRTYVDIPDEALPVPFHLWRSMNSTNLLPEHPYKHDVYLPNDKKREAVLMNCALACDSLDIHGRARVTFSHFYADRSEYPK